MAAGVSDKVWEIADIVKLVEEREQAEQEQKAERRINSLSRSGSALGLQRQRMGTKVIGSKKPLSAKEIFLLFLGACRAYQSGPHFTNH